MRFLITLEHHGGEGAEIPINYQYSLSAAIYRIIQKGDVYYSFYLREFGFKKGESLFTFSQIKVPFTYVDDRLILRKNTISITVAFHLPEKMKTFVSELFDQNG